MIGETERKKREHLRENGIRFSSDYLGAYRLKVRGEIVDPNNIVTTLETKSLEGQPVSVFCQRVPVRIYGITPPVESAAEKGKIS